MALTLTTTSAAFFGAIIESFLYGLFFILAILSTGLHVQRIIRNQGPNASRGVIMHRVLRNPMIMAGFIMFLTVTAHWVLDVVDTAYGILESEDSEAYFLYPGRPRALAGMGSFVASLVICDTMIVYRLWSVWNRSTVVAIFPFLCLLGMLAGGVGYTTHMAAVTPGGSLFSAPICRWVVIDSALNLVTNVYSTGFIAYRIHMINSDPAIAHGREDLKSVIAILIESAAFLSAWIVLGMITYVTKTPLDGFVRATLGTVSGVSFMLINVRVALSRSQTQPPVITSGSSAILTRPPTKVQIDTHHVNTHVDIPSETDGDGDNVYELDEVPEDRIYYLTSIQY
ncbi:hypothetical protein B0H12DRAFT_854835 [Mycena haematopus]|nr:hypothetical protein B0H12DRAFT_854835 [Mycena haematopus]